jgi:hypothetical protein
MVFDGEIIEQGGHRFRVNIERDDDNEPPWENSDGHGVVSEWTTRDKRPGERVLCSDRHSKRYYDVHETMKIAKRDGWGLNEDAKAELLKRLCGPKKVWQPTGESVTDGLRKREGKWVVAPVRRDDVPLTAGEITAEAVRRDFEFLRGWCNDSWYYVGVIVTHLPDPDDDDEPIDYTHALWGIESNSDDYIEEVAYEHVEEILRELAEQDAADAKEAAEALYWLDRGVITY